MRTPFLTISRGMVARTKTAFVQAERRKRWLASRLMISRAKLERIPLHSLATSIVSPGSEKVKPVRNTGTPSSSKTVYETSADPACSQRIAWFKKTSGMGTIRSGEHTSELQSQFHLVCRLLLEKKNPSGRPCPAVP